MNRPSAGVAATRFEFNYRFWFIGAIFWIGFDLAFFDHVNAAAALVHLVRPSLTVDGLAWRAWLRMFLGAGAALVCVAAWLRTWGTAYLREEVVHDFRLHSEAQVADGPFRYVRNPLYLGNILLAAGVGLMASRIGWLFIVAAMTIFVRRLIAREEAELLAARGDAFRAYLNAVPRLWPALRPRLPAGASQPHWGEAVRGELFVWLMVPAVIAFAATLRFEITGWIVALSFAVYLALAGRRRLSRRRQTPVQ